MCLDDIKGEVPKDEVFWTWAGGLTCFFLSNLVSARSQVSTTESRLAEFFNSLTSDNFSALLNSPSWMYAKCNAHVSKPSKIWVAYTIVAPLYRKYDNIIKDNIFVWIGCLDMSTSKACHIFYMWLAKDEAVPHQMIYWCVQTFMHMYCLPLFQAFQCFKIWCVHACEWNI